MTNWRILVVDDDPGICRQVKEFLSEEDVAGAGEVPEVETETDFDMALRLLEQRHFDLIILDVRRGSHDAEVADEAGLELLRAIQARRFVPILFYTGLPQRVPQEIRTPLVRVLEKSERLQELLTEVRAIFTTRIPAVNRALINHVEGVQRDYMWNFVAKYWDQYGEAADRTALGYFLARRLALSLSGPAIRKLIEDLGEPGPAALKEGQVHPMQHYVLPPFSLEAVPPLTGDLFKGEVSGTTGFWILLTPSCDLEWKKAERILLARCHPLEDRPEYREWQAAGSNKKRAVVMELMKNNDDQFHYLPKALTVPHLLVDFQSVEGEGYDALEKLERIATLDSPFAEALVARFSRYYGQLGTPDLNLAEILEALAPENQAPAGEEE